MAPRHRLANQHLVVAVGEGGVALQWLACGNRAIHRRVKSPKGVGESLRVTAGQACRPPTFLVENRTSSAAEVGNNIENLCLEFERLKPYLLELWNGRK